MNRAFSIITSCVLLAAFGSLTSAQKKGEDYYDKSQAQLINHDLDGALASLDKALIIKPDFAAAYFLRARVRLMKGDADAALADLDKALLIDPEMKDAYAERGRLWMIRGESKGALNDFDNAIARGYRSDYVYSSRGQIKLIAQDPKGSIGDYDVAISMNPHRIVHYLGRAAAREMAGDESGALADLTYVIGIFEKGESEREASGIKASAAAKPEMSSPMIKGVERPVTPTRDNNDNQQVKVTTRTDVMVTMSPGQESVMTAEEMEYLPNVAAAYLNRGRLRSEKGQLDAALADLDSSIRVNPYQYLSYHTRGEVRHKAGDLPGALADFQKTIELRSDDPWLYIEHGATLLMMGRDDEAEKVFAKCLALDPSYATAIKNRREEIQKSRERKSN